MIQDLTFREVKICIWSCDRIIKNHHYLCQNKEGVVRIRPHAMPYITVYHTIECFRVVLKAKNIAKVKKDALTFLEWNTQLYNAGAERQLLWVFLKL